MASANQIYFTIENVKRIQLQEICAVLGRQDPKAASRLHERSWRCPCEWILLYPCEFLGWREAWKGAEFTGL